MTTNVPSFTFTATGFVAPSGPAVLAGVQADINASFANTLNYSLTTPQGQLSMSWAAIIDNTYATFQYYAQQVDPSYSSGRMQDAIGRIYGMQRQPSIPTQLQISCVGLSGVVIPFGALIQDTAGNLYSCATVGGGTIPVGGSLTLQFNAVVPGPTGVPLTNNVSIYQTIPGWDAVSVVSGVIGQNVEGRSAFETRRQASVAGNSFGALGSILGAVSLVPNVTDFYGINNSNSAPLTTQGVTIPAYSIYICVAGGTPQAVANAIFSKKGAGAPMAGNTTVTVYDSNPLYSSPIPYQITYQIPQGLPILWNVQLVGNPNIPTNYISLVQNALVAACTGQSNVTNPPPKIRIGSTVYASAYASAIAALGSWAQISSIQVGSQNNTGSTNFGGTVTGSPATTLNVISGTVTGGTIAIGQFLEDNANAGRVLNGTTILAGAGSTWTISQPNALSAITATGNTSGASNNVTITGASGIFYAGDVIQGTGIGTNITLVSQTSSTGGPGGVNGVWVISGSAVTLSGVALTISPGLMTASAGYASTSVDANQVPVIVASNIVVSHT